MEEQYEYEIHDITGLPFEEVESRVDGPLGRCV
jgi:hypothetical protein